MMVSVLFYCTGKPGTESALRDLLGQMQRVSRAEDRAVNYTFMQRKKAPLEWALFEQWRDREHLAAHAETMKRHFGEVPADGQLPVKLHELVEKYSAVFYDALE
jgi:quinol monooxygenase YgiN